MITSAKEKKRHEIILDVLHRHGLTMEELISRSRKEHLVDARVEVASRLVDLGFSYNRIGKVLERDHSTVAFWLNHRRAGRLPQAICPISLEVRRYIENLAVEKKTTAKLVVIEWLTERVQFELNQNRSAA